MRAGSKDAGNRANSVTNHQSGNGFMLAQAIVCCVAIGSISLSALAQAARQVPQPVALVANPPLPDIRQLMQEVQNHQRQLDKVRESYTYTSMQTTQDIDARLRRMRTSSSTATSSSAP
jgi:hypothetical protein